ncbi:MAG TPA: hypothetical protein VNG29_02830 [Candidatus Paceibacterota bacterium]|nr:hypothetical protein [Candidatus Paceibacterota bacterium]
MKNTLKSLALSATGLLSAALPALVFAQTAPNPPITTASGLQTFICTVIVGWMFTFLVILTIVFVLIAAYRYLTASGDPEKVKGASHMLIYAAIAIVVAIFARGLPNIVATFIGSSTGVAC